MGRPDRVMTIVYAVGLTHHTTGSQLIRSASMLQLLLGNIGRPGGGMNAERGHANIQGNTDNAISWEILPGYLKVPAPGPEGDRRLRRPERLQEERPALLELLRHQLRQVHGEPAEDLVRRQRDRGQRVRLRQHPQAGAGNSSWMSIYDSALQGEDEGGDALGDDRDEHRPDSNQVMTALGNLDWLVVMDPLPTTSSEFWHAPGVDPASVRTEVFMLPTTHWIEKDGSFVNSGRWMQWKDQVLPAAGAGAARPLDPRRPADARPRALPEAGRSVPRPDQPADHGLRDPGEADARRDRAGGERPATSPPASGWRASRCSRTTAPRPRGTGSTPASTRRRGTSRSAATGSTTRRRTTRQGSASIPTGRGAGRSTAGCSTTAPPPTSRGSPGTRPARGSSGTARKWVGDVPDYPPTMSPTDPNA